MQESKVGIHNSQRTVGLDTFEQVVDVLWETEHKCKSVTFYSLAGQEQMQVNGQKIIVIRDVL